MFHLIRSVCGAWYVVPVHAIVDTQLPLQCSGVGVNDSGEDWEKRIFTDFTGWCNGDGRSWAASFEADIIQGQVIAGTTWRIISQ